jgi:hypothetical protein
VKIEVARVANIPDSSEYVATLKSRASSAIRPEVEGKSPRSSCGRANAWLPERR